MFLFLVNYPGVALGAVFILACIVRWSLVASDRRRTEYVLIAVIFTILISAVAQAVADNMSRLRPLKYDLFIYQFDGLFGQPSFALGRIVQRHLWLEVLLQVAYGIMPSVVAGLFAAYIYLRKSRLTVLLKIFVINLFAAPLFYLLLPVCGPQFAFPQFPHDAGIVIPHLVRLAAAPNGFPSVHTSTALLVLMMSWRWPVGRALGSVYLGLIILATLASGQHYLFDLLAAIPYALAVARLGSMELHRQKDVAVQAKQQVAPGRANEQFE